MGYVMGFHLVFVEVLVEHAGHGEKVGNVAVTGFWTGVG